MLQKIYKNSIFFCLLVVFISACTTTSNFPRRKNVVNVNPQMAQACINAAANKYYLPVSVIRAVDALAIEKGATKVVLKVDLRDALCTISKSGRVQSIVDTSPKSADQIAADEKAAEKNSNLNY